jgi:hypothetical protein
MTFNNSPAASKSVSPSASSHSNLATKDLVELVNAYKQRTYEENEIGYLEKHFGGEYSVF